MVINPIVWVYMPTTRIPYYRWDEFIPNIATFDPGTYISWFNGLLGLVENFRDAKKKKKKLRMPVTGLQLGCHDTDDIRLMAEILHQLIGRFFPFPSLPESSKYLVSRCLEPQKAFSGGVWGSKHLLTRYLED